MPEGADPGDVFRWLELWHDCGSQAHHPRADVVHPELDRRIWGMNEREVVGALQGLEHPDSSFDTIQVLELRNDGEPGGGPTLVVRFGVDETGEVIGLGDQSAIATAVHPTVSSVVGYAIDATRRGVEPPGPDVEWLRVSSVYRNRVVCDVALSFERAAGVDWETAARSAPRDHAAVSHSTATGRRRDVAERYRLYVRGIERAGDFTDLLGVVARYGPIQGSEREYSAGDLTTVVAEFREAADAGVPVEDVDFGRATRTLGFRERCRAPYRKAVGRAPSVAGDRGGRRPVAFRSAVSKEWGLKTTRVGSSGAFDPERTTPETAVCRGVRRTPRDGAVVTRS